MTLKQADDHQRLGEWMVKTKFTINPNSTVTNYYLVNRKNVDKFVNRPWQTAKKADEHHLRPSMIACHHIMYWN